MPEDDARGETVSISVFLDDASEPIATYKPPARFILDTTRLRDGEHKLRIHAVDALGQTGVRSIPFTIANGPGITVTGLRAGSRVHGTIEVDVNAFSSSEPFDPVRAESAGPVPVWTWVLIAIIAAWSAWYGIEYFKTPAAFLQTPTYAPNPALASLNAPPGRMPAQTAAPVAPNATLGSKNVAGFDYSALGASVYANNCQACHGASGSGVPGVFPSLAGDAVVNGSDADVHMKTVMHGLSGKTIGGTRFSAQMPAFESRLSDAEIAAVIDHERTSWGNTAPLVTPEEVARLR